MIEVLMANEIARDISKFNVPIWGVLQICATVVTVTIAYQNLKNNNERLDGRIAQIENSLIGRPAAYALRNMFREQR